MRRRKKSKPAPRPEPLTAPVEDYLKAIYAFERDGHAAATNDIAQRLSIAPASVSGMVQRLADQGLVAYERYRGVRLTAAGRRAALRTLRRHRVIEAYLVHALGYGWDSVHDEAERLEHSASDILIDRMAAAIGEPVTDPHGAPIPTREGTIDETPHQTLADAPVGARTRVVRVGDEDPGMLRYLDSLGLRPGAEVMLTNRAPFDGPLTIEVGSATQQVGAALASRVLVASVAD
ncbi:MAG TPA: metal-dependent transcriptional regulator [Gemmatimonadaceae bacterium]